MTMNPTVAFILQSQQDSVSRGTLSLWTVYDHPRDYPDGYIARKFEVKGDEQVTTKETLRTTDEPGLELLHDAFEQAGLVCMPRSEADDPQIIETWV
jgi:hypothetical protein